MTKLLPDPEYELTIQDALRLLSESFFNMARGFIEHVPNLLIGFFVILGTWLFSWLSQKVLHRLIDGRRMRQSLKDLFSKLLSISIWVAGLLAASIAIFPSVRPESILAGLGLSSIAIGFAFKDVVENFLAGFLILVREPLEIGDVIRCGDVEGRVEQITIRDTLIRQPDGQRVIVPNGKLFKEPVWIRTDQEHRRVTVTVGIAYGEDIRTARDVITDAVQGLESVDKSAGVEVFVHELNSSSVDFRVSWWTGSTPGEVRRSRDEVVEAVKYSLDDAGIQIPFPHVTLTSDETFKVERAS